MIPANFYPTTSSYGCGTTQNEFTDSLTAGIHVISDFMTNKCNAYWLGYISKDNLPMAFKYSMATYDTDNGFIFREATEEDNFPCGYCVGNKQIGSYNASPQYEVNQAYSDGAVCPSNYAHVALFNSLHPEYSGYGNYIGTANFPHLIFRCYIYDSNEQLVAVRGDESIAFNYKDLYDFLNGENTATLTVLGHSVVLTSEDLETGTCYMETDDNYFVRMFLVNYNFSFRPVLNGTHEAPTVLPAFMVHTRFNDGLWSGMFFGNQGVCIPDGSIARVLNNDVQWSYYWWSAYGGARAGLDGQITYDDYIALRNNGSTYGFLYDNNVLLAKSSSDYYFYPIFPIAEVKKHFSLMYRVDVSANGDTVSYVFGLSYATNVTEDNEFTASLKTGNITNPAFKDSLRPWQYSDIAVNEFTEDDVPPYEPTPPTPPTDDEEIGDTVNRPSGLGVGGTLGFVTQYSLTAAQVAALGRILWTSFLDPDYYKNFLFSLALDTGSFNMSSLLTYFISLRVYPFPLINVPSHAAAGSSMFVGAGTVPLEFSDTLHTINNYADYIDAGSVVVPRHYNDFRDYTDAEYMLYLPYCGTVQLNPGDVVGNTLSAQYAIDFATGACIAYVDLRTGDGHGYPIAALPGHIGADVPLTATNAGQVAAMLAGDAMHIAQTIGNVPATQISSGVAGFAAADTGNLAGAANSLIRSWTAPVTAAGQYAQHLATMATRPAIGIPMLSGGRGFGAFGAPQTAYLQIRRGLYKQPDNYAHTVGYASTVSKKIGEAQGLITAYVDTSTLTATADEAAEITALLKSGVIV